MSSARDDILAAVRAGMAGRDPAPPVTEHRLPARATGDHAALAAQFRDMAALAGATVETLAADRDIPAAVACQLAAAGLEASVIVPADGALAALGWAGSGVRVRIGAATAADAVSVTPVVAGIAETGTVLVRSGPAIANTAHLLCELHVAVLPADRLVGGYEAAWRLLADAPPRAATFITGPSRTADIEKTTQIGVHGPRRLHILLVDGQTTAQDA